MDYNQPGSFVHGIFQARILQWVAIPFSRGSSRLRDWTQVSCIEGRFCTVWVNKRYAKFPQNDKFYWNIIEYLDELKYVSHSQIRKLSIIKVSLLSQLVIDSMQCQPKISKTFCCCSKKKWVLLSHKHLLCGITPHFVLNWRDPYLFPLLFKELSLFFHVNSKMPPSSASLSQLECVNP